MHVFLIIGGSGFFLDNPASSVFLEYQYLTSDQKLAKSIVRKYDNLWTDYGRTSNILDVELNFNWSWEL